MYLFKSALHEVNHLNIINKLTNKLRSMKTIKCDKNVEKRSKTKIYKRTLKCQQRS